MGESLSVHRAKLAAQLAAHTPFFDYPPEIRKDIYTTNAIESLNMSLRKITKNRGSFQSDEALLKLFYLAIQNIRKNGRCRLGTGKLR